MAYKKNILYRTTLLYSPFANIEKEKHVLKNIKKMERDEILCLGKRNLWEFLKSFYS